jgi:hypothetical protein
MRGVLGPLVDGVARELPRELPSNVEAEQGLLGTLLCDNAAYERVCDFLRPEHFSYHVHGCIYAAIEALIQRGEPANPITLRAKFQHERALKAVGGIKYLASLALSAVTLLNGFHYARAIVEAARRRELVLASEELVERALTGGAGSDELIAQQRSALLRIGDIGHRPTDVGRLSPIALQSKPVPPRPWVCQQWVPDGHVTGIYGSGGVGKSLLGMQLATACSIGAPWVGLEVDRRRTLCMRGYTRRAASAAVGHQPALRGRLRRS